MEVYLTGPRSSALLHKDPANIMICKLTMLSFASRLCLPLSAVQDSIYYDGPTEVRGSNKTLSHSTTFSEATATVGEQSWDL